VACQRWFGWLRARDMGGFSSTLASQAIRTYCHKYMNEKIYIDDSMAACCISREAYHGGRCECFRIGKWEGEFTLLDFNSMYPAVMAEHGMPVRLHSVTRRATVRDLDEWCGQFCCVARVVVETNVPFAAVYSNGKLIFPVGRFECCLTTPEIQYGIAHGFIRAVRETAVYERALCFRGFVLDLYRERQEAWRRGDTVQAWQFKILLNSFYGKWGQRGRVWETVGTAPIEDINRKVVIDYETGKFEVYRCYGGIRQRLVKESESLDSHPAIAAHIAAHARHNLFQLIQRAKREECLYADTDSLLVTRRGFERVVDLVANDELGKLKIQGSYTRVKLYGCKDYEFDNIVRRKGIRAGAVQLGNNLFEQEKWSSLRGLLREGSLDAPQTRLIRKSLRRVYDKGVVSSDGTVFPFHLPFSETGGGAAVASTGNK